MMGRVVREGRKLRAQKGKIRPCQNKLTDNLTIQSSPNEDCSGPVFPCLCSSSHMPLTDGPTCPPGTTRGHHCEEMALQSAGAHSSSVFFFFSSPGSLSPACPSSPLLFTHRQLSLFPNAVIHSNILCSCFFCCCFPVP